MISKEHNTIRIKRTKPEPIYKNVHTQNGLMKTNKNKLNNKPKNKVA